MVNMRAGILAIQGDVIEHVRILEKLNVKPVLVRTVRDFQDVQALIIPGGESTAIGLELKRSGLGHAIKIRILQDMPVLGTCAGAILLSKTINGSQNFRFDIADIEIYRNEYGRQIHSFEAKVKVRGYEESMHAVFIRAPIIKKLGPGWEVLAQWAGDPVLIKKNNVIIATFHPELVGDDRVHRLLTDLIK